MTLKYSHWSVWMENAASTIVMLSLTFIIFIVSEKITVLKFLPHTDNWPAQHLSLHTHIFHAHPPPPKKKKRNGCAHVQREHWRSGFSWLDLISPIFLTLCIRDAKFCSLVCVYMTISVSCINERICSTGKVKHLSRTVGPFLEVGWLVSWCLKPSQTTKNYIRAEGYIVERSTKGRNKTRRTVRKGRVIGRIYGMKYSWKGHF